MAKAPGHGDHNLGSTFRVLPLSWSFSVLFCRERPSSGTNQSGEGRRDSRQPTGQQPKQSGMLWSPLGGKCSGIALARLHGHRRSQCSRRGQRLSGADGAAEEFCPAPFSASEPSFGVEVGFLLRLTFRPCLCRIQEAGPRCGRVRCAVRSCFRSSWSSCGLAPVVPRRSGLGSNGWRLRKARRDRHRSPLRICRLTGSRCSIAHHTNWARVP